MTTFHGAVETFGRKSISGWARYTVEGKPAPLQFELQFKGRAPQQVTQTVQRPEGTGFVFDLPPEFHTMPWPDFIAAYEGVLVQAIHVTPPLRWRPGLYKNVLLNRFEDVQATARVALPRRHAQTPPSRLAAVTLASGPAPLLPLWVRHHAGIVGPSNIFVIDAGLAPDSAARVPAGGSTVRLPTPETTGEGSDSRAAAFQRFLLETYDAVLTLPPDTFLCIDPALAAARAPHETLLALPPPGAIATAWSLWHDIDAEPEYDPARPLLAQRRLLAREPARDRPVLARLPAAGETAAETPAPIAGLHVLHLGMFDLEQALAAIAQAEAPDIDAAANAAGEIVARMRARNDAFAQASIMVFNPAAPLTVAAGWMRAALEV